MFSSKIFRLLALIMFALPSAMSSQTGTSAGHISAEVVRTTLKRGAGRNVSSIDADVGTVVQWNDVIQTDHRGRVRIVLNDQSVLTLGSDSQLRVVKHDAATQQTSLELAYGRIRAQVAQITRTGGDFQLRTPTSVAGVIGTDFGADASPGETKYVCLSGTTRIYSLDMSHYVDCNAGMTMTTATGENLPSPSPATTEQTDRWKHITEPGDPAYRETLDRGPGQAQGVNWHGLNISGNWRFRVEGWNWFTDGAAKNSYIFPQSILRLDMGQNRRSFDWQLELAQPALLGLPDNAIAAGAQGPLGLGGTYFAANGRKQTTAAIFPSKAFIRFKGLGGREKNQLTIGRFTFIDGTETVPGDKTLATLKQTRIAHRLIGDFNFAVTGRSQDGAALSLNPGRLNFTFAAARPTRGVYETDGLGELDVSWEYGAVTVPNGNTNHPAELRIFALGYQDVRGVVKTDNRPLVQRTGADQLANINIGTFGFHYLQAFHTSRSGTFEMLIWAVGQTGQWGLQRHRAGAIALEAGWQPPQVAMKPWIRVGYSAGSGDGNPNDGIHNTFFQVLPTPRVYARFPFFNLENNSDAFAMLLLKPTSKLQLRTDVHALWLNSLNDLWYQGGGAFQPRTFGFTGRPSGGARGLGNLWDASADYALSRNWSLNVYFGRVWGKGVERNTYPAGQNASFGYIETVFHF